MSNYSLAARFIADNIFCFQQMLSYQLIRFQYQMNNIYMMEFIESIYHPDQLPFPVPLSDR